MGTGVAVGTRRDAEGEGVRVGMEVGVADTDGRTRWVEVEVIGDAVAVFGATATT